MKHMPKLSQNSPKIEAKTKPKSLKCPGNARQPLRSIIYTFFPKFKACILKKTANSLRLSSNSRVPPFLIKDCRAANMLKCSKHLKLTNITPNIYKTSLKGIREKTPPTHNTYPKRVPRGTLGTPKS